MSKVPRKTLMILAAVLLLAAGILYGLYRAAQQVPKFYRDELEVMPGTQEKDSDRMVQEAATFYSNLQRPCRWQQTFEAKTINAWLAVDLPRNFPDSLPPGIREPRVHIAPEGITLGCRLNRFGLHGVISLEVSARVESTDVISLRIHKARLGAIPWSLDHVLKAISNVAQQSNVLLQWRQIDGDPVALITLPAASAGRGSVVHIDTISLKDGELLVAGTTDIPK